MIPAIAINCLSPIQERGANKMYIAQPYYSGNVVKIYSLPAASLVTTISLTPAVNGPNCVVLYEDSASVIYLFVSYDLGSTGAIDVYKFASINDLTTNPPGIPAATRINLTNSAVGMAIHPGTGDLYIATFSDGDGAGGIFSYSKSSGYTAATQFASNADPTHNNVAFYCANLAFDLHGNLWMTTFSDSTPADQFLVCFTQVSPAPDNSKFFKITNGSGFSTVVNLPGSATPALGVMLPFSQPEGIAFDPLGNLWLGNNNDDFATNGGGNGTLLKINKQWIDQNLLTAAYVGGSVTLTADGYGGTRTIAPNDPAVTVYYRNGAKFGGLFFDGFTLYANDQGSGNVWQMQTDAALSAATFKASGVSTTYPGNGGMVVFNATPAALLIRDVPGDTGAEPDGAIVGNVAWESPDIGVTQTSVLSTLPGPNSPLSSGTAALASDGTITGGSSAFVYVRVSNTGSVAMTGTEVLKVYWAKASAGLDWPAPWDGLEFDTSASKPVLGGLIGVQALGTIAPQSATIFEIPWANVPNSSQYSVNDQHFCLLARIETSSVYPFGMTFPEQAHGTAESAVIYNAESNSKIGWRNVAIVAPAAGGMRMGPIRVGILGANYASQARNVKFSIQTLDQRGKPVSIKGSTVLHAQGATLRRLTETKFSPHPLQSIGEGRFQLHDLAAGLGNVRLQSKEILPFHLEFTPAETVHNFALRVVQYVESNGVSKVVGGQTFVVGKVEGFPTRAK
jgi:hypothetical protein